MDGKVKITGVDPMMSRHDKPLLDIAPDIMRLPPFKCLCNIVQLPALHWPATVLAVNLYT